jgi:excisionase family DNA binding protein
MREWKGDILDVSTLAKLMGVCEMSIYRYMKRRDPLPGHKVGGKYLFFREEVEAWIRGRR